MKTREDIESLIKHKRDRIKHLRILRSNCRNKELLDKHLEEIEHQSSIINALEWVINE